jgi:hypothetical protein
MPNYKKEFRKSHPVENEWSNYALSLILLLKMSGVIGDNCALSEIIPVSCRSHYK